MDIYETHPRWRELEKLVAESNRLMERAKKLREEIDQDLFHKEKERSQNG